LRISLAGIELIKEYEGCELKAYRDIVGVLTIGYGHTGPDVYEGMVITLEEAEALLRADLERFERDVTSLVKVQITQGQFDALVSFAFNVGSDIDADQLAEGLGDSTLLKLVNAGDFSGAQRQFGKWINAGGKPVNGLKKRRAAEAALFGS
jgi:lysozyme